MKNKLLIVGAGGHGKVIADIALEMNKWDEVSFLDDNEDLKTVLGLKVLGKLSDASKYIKDWDLFVAIGSNAIRAKVVGRLEAQGATVPILIHPSAVVGTQVELGFGTAVMAGAVINCCSVIGKGCIINTAATVDHDNWIEDYVHISPGAHLAGTVRVGRESWLGIGCIISHNITVSRNCMIGAGAVVINDLTEPGTYIGVPARRA